ncbi:17129_t:CDS:2 [Cetraspora pellucida]|uniref:17129_t:CDS:1 n=1 Tax=Cetraspora pellucida TaxID=1433469 RepID=A0ACA9KV57_9GLOM|nr:17129_t:CDS:2 [Cetraspora pellucida]
MADYTKFFDPLSLILQHEGLDEKIEENKIIHDGSDHSSQPSTSQNKTSLPEIGISNQTICQACHINKWKYKCPKCEFHSCSLSCSKLHKETYDCNGIRSKTTYIPMDEYGYKELMSDYVFLEDISRAVDLAHRTRIDQGHKFFRRKYRNSSKSRLTKPNDTRRL